MRGDGRNGVVTAAPEARKFGYMGFQKVRGFVWSGSPLGETTTRHLFGFVVSHPHGCAGIRMKTEGHESGTEGPAVFLGGIFSSLKAAAPFVLEMRTRQNLRRVSMS